MTPVVLFDWGDTLMVDYPQYSGKMRDWPEVAALPGAHEALAHLCRRSILHVASGAGDSTADDIRLALSRVGLDRFITGIFCRQNTGFAKPDPRFFRAILENLRVTAGAVTMVGDSLEKDILPCHRLGIRTVLLSGGEPPPLPSGVGCIRSLHELVCLT
ncbi:MAG: HAD family hydrolase [Desulfobulbaceae bacterium]|nr:MAG: HAD family hydrolase [Desulfobulbaceae bacterium]